MRQVLQKRCIGPRTFTKALVIGAALGAALVGASCGDNIASEAPGRPDLAEPEPPNDGMSAQLLGTHSELRGRWNPFLSENFMTRLSGDATEFRKTVALSPSGGRHGDGVYAVRFTTNSDLDQVFKADPKAEVGRLLTAERAYAGQNIIFRVTRATNYRIDFDPRAQAFAIEPAAAVEYLSNIESMQINGFVYDDEGGEESSDGLRTRAAQVWDETRVEHNMEAQGDGVWAKTMPLSTAGGHEKNGVYQMLFSANHNADWAYGARIGKPGQLSGGNGYASKVGRADESSIVFRVPEDGDYTISIDTESYTYWIEPEVEILTDEVEGYQVNGSVVEDPWNPLHPAHQMTAMDDGSWLIRLPLSASGGEAQNGRYVMNFSINGEWALDSIGYGGIWGHTWHALPQERNILFQVAEDGVYDIRLWPDTHRFDIEPPVEGFTAIESLRLVGSMTGWDVNNAEYDMHTDDGVIYTFDVELSADEAYYYKYTANDAAWSWTLADYNYDGYRQLSWHGDPPAMSFTPGEDGLHRFTANVATGTYSVAIIE